MSAITLHIQIKTHIYIIESLVHVTYVIVRHYMTEVGNTSELLGGAL